MPELPDVTVYVEAIEARVVGVPLEGIRLASPFLLRTVEPKPDAFAGRLVRDVRRLGKRIVLGFDDALFLALHLMIAGRLRWRSPGAPIPKRLGLAAFDFARGTLLLTEASKKKRAALHLVRGEQALGDLAPVGLEVLGATLDDFRAAIGRERHTLKRTLTDPRILSGIGNAYSDEILHHARLSPVRMSDQLSDEESTRLYDAVREILTTWTDRLRDEAGGEFPEKVTAFREGMAVHGRYRQPCPACATPIQRIARAENESNYCPTCQTGGKLLADRALSKLLHADWPRTAEELEERRSGS